MVYLVWHEWSDEINRCIQKELVDVYKHEDRAQQICDRFNSPFDSQDYYYIERRPINYSLKEGSD